MVLQANFWEKITDAPIESLYTREQIRQSGNDMTDEILRRNSNIKDYNTKIYNRTFIPWDGEGITPDPTKPHKYILFGCSLENSVRSESLTTIECFELMLKVSYNNPSATHISFSFSYDVEMILVDLPVNVMRRLYKTNLTRWRGYTIEYLKFKWFRVTGYYNNHRVTIKIFDVFTFFATSFINAIEQYLEYTTEIDKIKEGKESRSVFTYDELDDFIIPYWQLELEYLVLLMNKLRELLEYAGIKISSWHGPGAIASELFKQHHVDAHTNTYQYLGDDGYYHMKPIANGATQELFDAAQYAYAAGRFELFSLGWLHNTCYKYDINSAYPSAMEKLPSFDTGRWYHTYEYDPNANFAVWYISYDGTGGESCFSMPHPFFVRGKHAEIRYPDMAVGWYWNPEVTTAMRYHGDSVEVLEGWIFKATEYPFKWVQGLYDTRLEWKDAGIMAQLALKLGINSLYGKTAQRTGYEKGKKIPKYHDLCWAGWITSYTRATLYDALWQAWAQNSLIACETDCVVSSKPLTLPISKRLGEWDYDEYDDAIYIQNGIYFMHRKGEWLTHARGFDKGSLVVKSAIEWLYDPSKRFYGTDTRFVGGKVALNTDINKWRHWIKTDRVLNPYKSGKRIHVEQLCTICKDGLKHHEAMHTMVIAPSIVKSTAHYLPWRTIEGSVQWVTDGTEEQDTIIP